MSVDKEDLQRAAPLLYQTYRITQTSEDAGSRVNAGALLEGMTIFMAVAWETPASSNDLHLAVRRAYNATPAEPRGNIRDPLHAQRMLQWIMARDQRMILELRRTLKK